MLRLLLEESAAPVELICHLRKNSSKTGVLPTLSLKEKCWQWHCLHQLHSYTDSQLHNYTSTQLHSHSAQLHSHSAQLHSYGFPQQEDRGLRSEEMLQLFFIQKIEWLCSQPDPLFMWLMILDDVHLHETVYIQSVQYGEAYSRTKKFELVIFIFS